ncbi:MAG TPA: RNA polymerase sigma factor [Rhodanobacteraceae bacterium]|nr:RNA polymerase sigma factor [Rhodanobacteraceae bacterium]
MTASPAEDWFVREVLPLEAALMQFLQHNWRNKADIADLRQDVYVQVFDAAHTNIPDNAKAFVFQTARNLLINRLKREHIVPIEAVADVEALNAAIETPGPERNTIARDELRRLQAALDRLPPRCREAVVLGRIEGLSGREIAARMGITEQAVSAHLINGVRALVNEIYGDDRRRPS